jgi:lipopolysaccharide/colanic/teichoic acid biosynthesis glycosyltransferase
MLSRDKVVGEAYPVWLGRPSELASVIKDRGISQVVLADDADLESVLPDVLAVCQAEGCRLLVYNNYLERLPVAMSAIVEDGLHFLTAQDEPLEDPANRAIKRLFDVGVSLPAVVLILPPLCLCVWVMQRLQSPGPLFFSRPRGGQRGSQFHMLKFRSMRSDQYDPALEARQAKYGDPRIYRFGHLLRKTSLDEFPQFWNVLKGDMTIVGPRPHLPQHDVEFSLVAKTYRTRQLVKPGITGLAQVRGYRGEITDPRLLHLRVQADIEYITNWTIWLDIQITLSTIFHVFAPPPTAR